MSDALREHVRLALIELRGARKQAAIQRLDIALADSATDDKPLRGKGRYRLDEAKARIAELEEVLRSVADCLSCPKCAEMCRELEKP